MSTPEMTPCPTPAPIARRSLIAALGVFLTACGGGGSSAAAPVPPAPAPTPTPPPPPPAPTPAEPPILTRPPLYLPSGSKRLLFAGQDMVALGGITDGSTVYSGGYLDDTELRPQPVGVTTYLQVMDSQGLSTTFHNSGEEKNAELTVSHAAFAGSKPLLAIGYFLDNNYDTILNGGRDTQLKALADWIKAKNLPVFLRIGYEFNSSWTGHPSNRTAFINAYRYIASKIQGYGATQVAFVWQSDGTGSAADLMTYYPGDAYVDWVSYTHFDNKGEGILAIAKAQNKPVMIGEATPLRFNLAKAADGDGKAAWDAWFQPLLDHMTANPQIRALAYINDNWPAKPMWATNSLFNTTDSRVQRSAYVKAKWLAEMGGANWLTRAEVLAAIGFKP